MQYEHKTLLSQSPNTKEKGHDNPKAFKVMIFETIHQDTRDGDRPELRLQRETY